MPNQAHTRKLAILGSTGSIGTQALEVVRHHPSLEVEVLTAHSNAPLLIRQAKEFMPNAVVIANKQLYPLVRDALVPFDIKVFSGSESVEQIVESATLDIVLIALVGWSGLLPTLNAIKAGKTVALANKETLVVAGELVTRLARENGVNLYPVDSEHSAIFQCLAGEFHNPIKKLYLTASGGPFRGMAAHQLQHVGPEQALRHPNWNMGHKVTIDSATLMNKGLEVIEARWLFGVPPEKIEVLVHPQSIVHSMVEFADGSIKAQMGSPDMRLPIQYALLYPQRLQGVAKPFEFGDCTTFTFEKPDTLAFPCLGIAYECLRRGGNSPCILNAADEVAVAAFLDHKISFTQIPEVINHCLDRCGFHPAPDLECYQNTDAQAREIASRWVDNLAH